MARSMKNSGVDWIETIPRYWFIDPIKNLFVFGNGLNITKADLVEEGCAVINSEQILSKKNTGMGVTDELIRYIPRKLANPQSLVKKGDFIFVDRLEDLDSCGNYVYVDRDDEIYAGHRTIVLRKNNKICYDKYIAYLFKTDCWRKQIRTGVNGPKFYSIPLCILSRTSLLVPPPNEQKAIADFLDVKCAEIDRRLDDLDKEVNTLAEKQKKIEDLESYKSSLIDEYVTFKKQVPYEW